MIRKIIACAAAISLSASLAASTGDPDSPHRQTGDGTAWAAACEDWDDWDKPGPPFRIHGNAWYVGTCGIAAILVTGDAGHILIDSGTDAGARVVASNIAALGFRLQDVKLLLHSHEHHDHIGGLNWLQRESGARLIASAKAAEVITSGKPGADDPQFGLNPGMAAARVDSVLRTGEVVRLGSLRLRSLPTPGHTPGALTWHWQSCDGVDCRTIVYADSLSPYSHDSYRFSDHRAYVAAYRRGLGHLARLKCDVLLTPHPSASDMRDRLLSAGGLPDPQACRRFAASVRQRLSARLAKEAGNTAP